MGKEGNIINILTYQLNELENLIKKDVERGNMIYDFYINEEECKLLDFDKLQTYLTEVDIKNLASLKDIYQRCNRINNLWNDDLRLLKPKRLDKAFNISPEECKSRYFIHSIMDFHLIYLTAIKFHYITFEDEKKKFMIKWADNSTLKTTHLAKINTKCHDIRNLLINFYPTLRLEEDPKEGLIQYRNFGEYGFTPRPYKKNEYKLMKNVFNIYLSNCEYIFLSLDKNERHEFKTDVINNLNDVKNIQVLPKFKGLLSEIIVIANNNFKPPQQITKTKEEEKDLENKDKTNNYKHTKIFKKNAFEVWQSMFDAFDINKSSRTDVRFMYEAMKKDGLIHDTIGETDIRRWIDEVYEISLEKLPFTDIQSNSNKKRRSIYKQSKTNYNK